MGQMKAVFQLMQEQGITQEAAIEQFLAEKKRVRAVIEAKMQLDEEHEEEDILSSTRDSIRFNLTLAITDLECFLNVNKADARICSARDRLKVMREIIWENWGSSE